MTVTAQPVSAVNAERILVIKLGALGDFIQAFGPFHSLRKTYPDAHISLLTTAPFAELARKSTWFDSVQLDNRPRFPDISGALSLRNQLQQGKYDLVVDLQTSDRSSGYRKLFWPQRPLWSGIANGASHKHENPDRDRMHTMDRQADQLKLLGIDSAGHVDMGWITSTPVDFPDLSDRYALLLPGGAAHRPEKRWPAEKYGDLAVDLATLGLQPVVLGTEAEAAEAAVVQAACGETLNLIGKTDLFALGALAARAEMAVGNDTGPMHLAAVCGCPSVVLFSHASDPALCGPRGPRVAILQNDRIADISVKQVVEAAEGIR